MGYQERGCDFIESICDSNCSTNRSSWTCKGSRVCGTSRTGEICIHSTRGRFVGAVRPPLVQPLAIVGVSGLLTTLRRLLHVENNGLQDGSFEFNGYRYEGVPIPVMDDTEQDE